MSLQQSLTDQMQSLFQPLYLEVVNESHRHSGPKDAESHFKITLVSDAFEGLRRVQRHQKIYGVLADELKTRIHALALHLYTEAEWHDKNEQTPDSTNCMGGSKRG
jgi:BolA protein